MLEKANDEQPVAVVVAAAAAAAAVVVVVSSSMKGMRSRGGPPLPARRAVYPRSPTTFGVRTSITKTFLPLGFRVPYGVDESRRRNLHAEYVGEICTIHAGYSCRRLRRLRRRRDATCIHVALIKRCSVCSKARKAEFCSRSILRRVDIGTFCFLFFFSSFFFFFL